MTSLDRKIKRDALQSWLLIAAVSLIIAVGIASFVSMMSAYLNLEQALNHYYGKSRLADFWIDLKKAPEQEAARLKEFEGVAEIRSRIQFRILLDLEDSSKPIGSLLLSLPDDSKPVLNNIILQKGSYFTPGRQAEVIVSEKFAVARNIKPGDTLTAILNNQRKKLTVVGTAISAEFVYMTSPGSMLDEPGTYGLMWIKQSFAETVFGFENSTNSVVGKFTPKGHQNDKLLLEKMSEKLKPYGVIAATPQREQFSPLVLDGEMTQLKSMAVSMPSFFLVVATLILNIMMTRMAEQQRTSIGTLKALGYSNWQLTGHFLKYAFIPGLAGGIGGCILGYLLGALMTEMYLFYFSFPHLAILFYPELILAGIAVSILFAMLGTIKGIRKVIRLEPAEAMRAAPPPYGGAVILEKIPLLWKKLDTQWQMVLRGLLRHKGRTAVSIFAATIGSSIVLMTFGFINSLDEMISLQFERSLKSDYHLSFAGERPVETVDAIKQLPGVINAEPVLQLPCTFRVAMVKEKGGITGIQPNSQLTALFNDQNEKLTLPAKGLAMSQRMMDKLGISIGDKVYMTPVKGAKREITIPVVQSLTSLIGLGVYCDIYWLNSILAQQPVQSEIRVKLGWGANNKKLFEQRLKTIPGIEGITDIGSQKAAMVHQQDSVMGYAALAMIGFAATIFLGTILNTSMIAISERVRDIATFRTLGYHQGEVATQFLKENMTINLIGTFFGIPLGYVMLISTMDSFATDAYSMPAALEPMSLLYTLLLTVVFVLIAQYVVTKKIGKLNWVEALSLKE